MARYIPAYFFLGGLAAGSSLIAAGADAVGDVRLARVARATALAATAGGAGALVADLGRPERFHHMLRVFRPSSPMNVGSWLLAAYGPAVGIAALADVSGRAPAMGRAATWSAAALAPAIATYTGVLVADTAVPAWHETRHTLPALFGAGAAASAGGVATMLVPSAAPARRVAIGGAVAELATKAAVTRALPPDVGGAYGQSRSHTWAQIATGCLAVGAGLCALARGNTLRRLGGAAIAVGAAAERFAVMEAGTASALDPRATIARQRQAGVAAEPGIGR